ncbi:hypothetical protein HDU99_003112 [Rhizoclosmatium hyalinum]|nr:hypothetical protein HDU99_003112 [Rhizoclosmatium hyalinum]
MTVSQEHRRDDGGIKSLAYEIFNFRTCGIVAVIMEFTVCNSNNYDDCPDQYLSSSRFTEMFDPTRVKGTGYTGQTCADYIPHYWIALPSVDMYGFDIGSKKSVDKGRDCIEYCAWISECRGFVYSKQYERCWFKSILNGWDIHLDSDRILYVPTAMANSLIFGIDYWGNDIAEYAVTSNDACRNMCSRYANCETAVFRSDLSKCYVKSSVFGTPVINQYARLSFKPMNSLLLGVGTDHNLYWRDPEIPVWKIVGAGIRLLDIVQLSDWSLLAVGEDNKLYWTIGLFQSSGWSVVPGSGSVTRIALVAGGAYLVGIGMDCELYSVMISKGFNSQGLQGGFSWYHIGNTGCVKDVLQLPNGWIGGIGTDNKLYFKTSWDTNWQMAPNFNGEVTGLTVLKDQTLIGIGMDGSVWRMNSWDTGFPDGAPLTKSCCFISISTAW